MAEGVALAVRAYLCWPVRLWALRQVTDVRIASYIGQWLVPLAASAALALVAAAVVWALGDAPPVVMVAVAGALGGLAYLVGLRVLDRELIADLAGMARRVTRSVPAGSRARAA